MTGYVRKDTTNNIADGNVINAADLDAEFDGVQAAFNASTGHKHDGTASEGATINSLGPTQDVTISASLIAPKTTNFVDIGSSGLKFKDMFLAGNGSIGGTLAVTGVATFTAQPILSSLTASRAVFSDGSKGLVSNAITGTGNVVMSASPTLTGTVGGASLTLSSLTSGRVTYAGASGLLQDSANLLFNGTTLTANTLNLTNALGTSYGGTGLSSFTSGGVVYASSTSALATGSALVFDGTNLGIGTSSPGYKLTVNGRISYSGAIGEGADTTVSSTGTNLLWGNSSTWLSQIWYTGGSERMRLDSSGNLGIGTSSPSAKLDISAGNLFLTQDYEIQWKAGAATRAAIRGTSSDSLNFYTRVGGTITETMRLDSSGNLGIGTSSPANKLTVKPSASSSGTFDVLTGSTNTDSIRINGGGTLNTWLEMRGYLGVKLYSDTTNTVTVDSSGNLGLGVTPSAWGASRFAIETGALGYLASSGSQMNVGQNNYFDGTNFIYKTTGAATIYQQISGAHYWNIAASGTAGNAITFTQAMTLDASGNLLIGGTSSAQLDGVFGIVVGGSSKSSGGVVVESSTSAWMTYTADPGQAYIFYDSRQNLERARIDSSGNLGVGVTPSAWVDDKALQLPQGSVSSGYEYGISVAAGAYRSASNIWKYTQSAAGVSRFNQVNGAYQWFTAPSGTAGNAITFTQAMTLDASGNLGIGTTSPSASAILDAQSTTKGVRMPNMTTTQKNAIASPAAGLMVFDTTLAKLCVYSGSAWQTITSI